jgi:hypothetical protein
MFQSQSKRLKASAFSSEKMMNVNKCSSLYRDFCCRLVRDGVYYIVFFAKGRFNYDCIATSTGANVIKLFLSVIYEFSK